MCSLNPGLLSSRQDWQCTTNSSPCHTCLRPFRSGESGPLKQDCHATSHAHFSTQKQEGTFTEHCLLLGSSWGWAGKGGDAFDKNKDCIRHKGMRYFSGAIFHNVDSNKIGKLNSFVPDTMAAVEGIAGGASGAKVTAGHGRAQFIALQWPEGVAWASVSPSLILDQETSPPFLGGNAFLDMPELRNHQEDFFQPLLGMSEIPYDFPLTCLVSNSTGKHRPRQNESRLQVAFLLADSHVNELPAVRLTRAQT